MAFEIGTGGGGSATVQEPVREQYPDNLSGAVQYALSHALYKVLETMGGAVGSFLAGLGVQFLGRIEPSLVSYTRPLIDMILKVEGLDPDLARFLTQLREPTHEGAAAILTGLSSQAGGAVMGSLLNSLLAPATYGINKALRPGLPSVTDAIAMWRRGKLSETDMRLALEMAGYKDVFIEGYLTVTQPRAGVSDLVMAAYRGNITGQEFHSRMAELGFAVADANLFVANAEQIPDVGSMIRAWFRGEMSPDEVRENMGKMGYTDIDITTLLNTARPIPSPPDLVRMGVREAFHDDIAARWDYDADFPTEFGTWMERQGYRPEWAKYYWRAHWVLPSLTQGYEMYHRGVIDLTTLRTLLRIADIPRFWREKLIDIAFRPLTRVDVRRMFGLGVLDRSDVYRSYLDLGYNPTNAERMTEFTVRYETDEGGNKAAQYKALTKSVVMKAYGKGVITQEQTTTRLMDIGYDTEEINVLVSLSDMEREIEEAPDYYKEYEKDIRSIIEKSYARRIVSKAEALSLLGDVGYGPAEAECVLRSIDFWYSFERTDAALKQIQDSYVRRGLNRQDAVTMIGRLGVSGEMQTQLLNEWDIERNTRSRRLTEAQYRRALREDVINQAEYQENLRGLGYAEYDVWVLTAMAVGKEEAGFAPQSGPLVPADRA